MTPTADSPTFVAVSDHALLVEFATEFEADAHEQVLALDRRIAAHGPDNVVEVVPALINLLVVFDPMRSDHDTIETVIRSLLNEPVGDARAARRHQVAVCYHDTIAPDLAAVADACGISSEAVVNAHLGGDYRVLMYGFAPGYAYLSGVPEQIRVPRKPSAIRDVSAGSVIIADHQCLITTLTMPTGWSIIGRSHVQILPTAPGGPMLLDPGDHVAFTRVDLATFEQVERAQ